jgi:hypothetical protein
LKRTHPDLNYRCRIEVSRLCEEFGIENANQLRVAINRKIDLGGEEVSPPQSARIFNGELTSFGAETLAKLSAFFNVHPGKLVVLEKRNDKNKKWEIV